MKKSAFIILLLTLGLLPVIPPVCGQEEMLLIHGNLRVLSLEGTPHERGLQHGRALKEDIHALIKLWKEDIAGKYETDPDAFIKTFLAETDFREAVETWTPELMEEVKGMAEGAGVDFETMFAFQLLDEMWVLGGEILEGEHCTTVAVDRRAGGPAMVSQTLDIPPFYHGFQTLLRITDKERNLQTLLFTFPGFIAANGLNSASVSVVVNAVQQLEHSRDGLPVAFVIRGILQRKTFGEALGFLRSITFGAPQNYLIGGRERVGSFECSAGHIAEFRPFPEAPFTYHTNHPLRNTHFTPRLLETFRRRGIDPEKYRFRCRRFQALNEMLKNREERIDVERLKAIYRDRETGINNRATFGVTIMVLGNGPPVLYISPGRPDETPYQIFSFKK
jgi:isopenicillin-N N-acyltransferase-like protein